MNHTQELIEKNVDRIFDVLVTMAYKPGWAFTISSGIPQKFVIKLTDTTNSFTGVRDRDYPHYFDIPTTDMTYYEIERYILDRIADVDRHEAMENLKFNGVAVFLPDHDDVSKLYQINRRQ